MRFLLIFLLKSEDRKGIQDKQLQEAIGLLVTFADGKNS
jgi:hypothetical protein